MKVLTSFICIAFSLTAIAQSKQESSVGSTYVLEGMVGRVSKKSEILLEFTNTDVCTWKFQPEQAKLFYTQISSSGKKKLADSWLVLEISRSKDVDSYLVEGEMTISNYVTGESEKFKGEFTILFYHNKEMVSYEISENHHVLMGSTEEWNNQN